MHDKRTRKTAIAFALALLLAALPRGAVADDQELAKAKFQEGLALIKEENYPAALAAFEESYRLVPKQIALYNIAMCQKALFRYVDSIASFEKYLAAAGAEIAPDMKLSVERALSDMRKMVGTVVIEGAPDGAEAFVDERSAGLAPFAGPLIVDPGSHAILVERAGYKPFRAEVNVPQGVTLKVSAKLQQAAAWIEIACDASDAVIRLDGDAVGGCPYEGEVQPGEHEVNVQVPGEPPFVQRVEVTAGGTATVAVTPRTGAEPRSGSTARGKALLVSGIAGLALGAGGVALGLAFNVKGMKDEARAEDAPPNSSERKGLNGDIETDKAVMIAGYAVGGALIAAGVVLVVLSRNGSDEELRDAPVAFAPTLNGLSMSF